MTEQTLNRAQQIAQKRIYEINYARKRIMAKIEAKHPRTPDLIKRLEEYKKSMKLLEFTLETGRLVRLKGDETENGVTIEPPAGEITIEGKS